MAAVQVISAQATTLEKLEKELSRALAGCAAEDILGLSHHVMAASTKQTGGIWGGAAQTYKLEYTAVVLVRTA